jgi:hypothetical protein
MSRIAPIHRPSHLGVCKKMIVGTSPFSALYGLGGTSSSPQADGNADFASVVANFEKQIKESPFQRMFDAVLKEHGLTQEQYEHLTGPQKDAITKEVTDDLKKSMQKGQSPATSLQNSVTSLQNSVASLF